MYVEAHCQLRQRISCENCKGGKYEINLQKMRRLRGRRASARLLSSESLEVRELRLVSQRD
jgi:hypothetical protein